LDRVPTPSKIDYACDILSAMRAMDYGVTAATSRTRERYWKHWCNHCHAWRIDPMLSPNTTTNEEVIISVMAFASRVRTGTYGRGFQVSVPSVTDAISAISTTIQLAGGQSRIHQARATNEYKLPIKRQIEGLRRMDPPPTPQLAVPITVPQRCCEIASTADCSFLRAQSDLCTIAFFYLLRVGEYTNPMFVKRNGILVRATRTKQFSMGDVGFFKNGHILSRKSPLSRLLTADSATLKITNQKNGRMGQTIHHTATAHPCCPIKALARRVHNVLSNGGSHDHLLCDFWSTSNNTFKSVSRDDIIRMLRITVKTMKLDSQGIDPDLIGAHSLRAGGAMALKLHGCSDSTIRKMGRWTSDTFLQYIHNQIAHLSHDLSDKMSTPLPFLNIAAIESTDADGQGLTPN
jgi:hypothetical protein